MFQSDSNPTPPSQSILDEEIGNKIIDPFRRKADKIVSDAKKWIRNCELMFQKHLSDPGQHPSETDVKLMREYILKLHQHRSNLNGLTLEVEEIENHPMVVKNPQNQQFMDDILAGLEESEYQRTLTGVSNTIAMFEFEFNSREIPLEIDLNEELVGNKTTEGAGLADLEHDDNINPRARSQVTSPEPSTQFIEDDVHNTKDKHSSVQPNSQGMTPKLMDDILYTIQRIQTDNERDRERMFEHLMSIRQDNQVLTTRLEKLEKVSPKSAEPIHNIPEKKMVKRSQKSEKEHKRLYFSSSSSSSDEGMTDFGQVTSLDEDDYYTDDVRSKSSRLIKSNRRNQSHRDYRPKGMKLEDVRQNLITFDGTGRFETFRILFKEIVLENDGINDLMKAVLLEQHLKGEASKYLYPLEDPTESIRLTFQDLRRVYGCKAKEMSLYDKFNSLPFHPTDCDRMICDIAAHKRVLAQLAEHKVNINDCRTINTFTRKLPPAMSKEVIRYIAKTNNREILFDSILKIVNMEIEYLRTSKSVFGENKTNGLNEFEEPLAAIHYTNAQSRQQDHQYGGNAHLGNQNTNQTFGQRGNPRESLYDFGEPTPKWGLVAWSFPFRKPEQGAQCAACEGQHNMIRCPLSSTEFRKRIKAKNLCERCSSSGHSTTQCQSWLKCGYCRGDHIMGACSMKEYYRIPANIPNFCQIKNQDSPRNHSVCNGGVSTHSQ